MEIHRIGSIFVSGQEKVVVTMQKHRARASTPPETMRSRPKVARTGLSASLRPLTDATDRSSARGLPKGQYEPCYGFPSLILDIKREDDR